MSATAAVREHANIGLGPFTMKDASSFIETQFPVGRVSAEAYAERKAGSGQTLTALGSYWKGRKPLILVRSVVLGALLPATDSPTKDLEIFLKLLAMDDSAFGGRFDGSASEFARIFPAEADILTESTDGSRIWREEISESERRERVAIAFAALPNAERVWHVRRPEECDEQELLAPIWPVVNAHLGTNAESLVELIQQLGHARFGHRPKVADTFCGGGSIPFEAARIGCDAFASDLNPVACMLTWGAANIIGADPAKRAAIDVIQRETAKKVDTEFKRLRVESDPNGNRAKAFLYCLEARCTKTDWLVPLAPSLIISNKRSIVAQLVPNERDRRYDIVIVEKASLEELELAKLGTIWDGRLVHPKNTDRSGVEFRTIRGDYRDADGTSRNRLRLWEKLDFVPRAEDIFQERLYCIQWITKESLHEGRQKTFFAAVGEDDLIRERTVESIVRENLARWQAEGLVPDMPIQPGDETTRLLRERGWTHWHHLFNPRQLLLLSLMRANSANDGPTALQIAHQVNWNSKQCAWFRGFDTVNHAFENQSLRTLFDWGCRSSYVYAHLLKNRAKTRPLGGTVAVEARAAEQAQSYADVFITDPPYADAINYHEITEFFIAWLRKNPPPPFDQWSWDSHRDLAIKGKDEHFRRDMVAAYSAMTKHMPDNGLQVVMFTHQDAGVWADLGAILWAAGLRVMAAWNIVTETESALKEGNYVQGTVCLVLRKRLKESNARRMEIEAEIEDAVRAQLDRLAALDEAWQAEALYTDGDLTLAAYAAALQVVTSYSTIDRQPLDRDLYRRLSKGERTMMRDLVDYAAQVANGLLVPTGFPREAWGDLRPAERFYVRMLDMEAKGATKVADFQNFAKSFAFADYQSLMASTAANAARLAGAADFKGSMLDGEGFAETQLRQVLFAVWKAMEKRDPKVGVTTLRSEYAADYWQRRQKLIGLADYIAAKTGRTRPAESAAAHELAEALKLDRV